MLDFGNYAQRSLATKMARSPEEVMRFLNDLAQRSVAQARRELEALAQFAEKEHGCIGLEPWDLAYYSEKLRQHRYRITAEELRPYFPLPRVLEGMFAVVWRLFDIRIREVESVETWHPDVRFFEIRDSDGEPRGQFYLCLLYTSPSPRD